MMVWQAWRCQVSMMRSSAPASAIAPSHCNNNGALSDAWSRSQNVMISTIKCRRNRQQVSAQGLHRCMACSSCSTSACQDACHGSF